MVGARPAPLSTNPVVRLASDFRVERAARGAFPPGPSRFDGRLTHRMAHDPLPILLDCYERYGPVFSQRIFHARVTWALGPEANHYMTVSHAGNFRYRESSFGDMIPLLGDGLLTTDGEYHRRARRIMLPAFHHERIEAATAVMADEAERALEPWHHGDVVDVYHWARELAMRIAMRALLGLDPDDGGHGEAAAVHFERALSFYGTDYPLRLLRGPGSPWRRMLASRRVLDEIVFGEIARRRAAAAGGRDDILSLALEARDEDGSALSDREVRDQAMTLMFAGHDTSTSTIAFLLYELARHPEALEHELEWAIDETLRLYPPAWIGPRRAVDSFELCGQQVPADAYVNYCSWASHRLPDVFEDPHAFEPERMAPERKAALPKGAYVPFGGGSRMCIGMRFGQTEIRTVASLLLERFRPELVAGERMVVRQMPTLSPKGGLRLRMRRR